ncbi:MAG: type II toxin-antitoxin system VapC family toxin [Gammaproteobacteria bacterium]|nr:type II toxin-antitoxin system VapC family toxin [Gammaproteobacteria bacterium]
MSLRYLLDTNIISDLVRHPRGRVAARIAEAGEDSVCTSIVVAAELRYGAKKSESHQLSERINLLLSAIEILPLESPTDQHYAALRYHLTRQGRPIGPNDLLIAAHALAADLTLVTAKMGEFGRVPSLRIQNWLVEPDWQS